MKDYFLRNRHPRLRRANHSLDGWEFDARNLRHIHIEYDCNLELCGDYTETVTAVLTDGHRYINHTMLWYHSTEDDDF